METNTMNIELDLENTFAYCRCSTNSQDAEYEIRTFLDMGIDRSHIYVEYVSGASETREVFDSLMSRLEDGVSCILVTDITRLVRSTFMFCKILQEIEKRHLRLIINKLYVDCRQDKLDVMVEGMLKISAVFGEMERKLKIFQINLGLDNARAKGVKLGRKKVDAVEQLPDIFKRYYIRYASGELNKSELARICNLSYPSILKYIKIVEHK